MNRSRRSARRNAYAGTLEGAAQEQLNILHGALSAFIAASTYYNADQGWKHQVPNIHTPRLLCYYGSPYIDPRSNIMINGYISCKNPISFCFLYFLYFSKFDRRNWKNHNGIRIAQNGLDSTGAAGKLTVGCFSLCAFPPLLARNYIDLLILSPLRVKLFYLWISCALFE